MPSICVCLSKNPLLRVFSFSPGDRITIHVSFDEANVPERYRLQILDKNLNPRLNRYGKGFSDIIVKDWPIPSNIREKHFGTWLVRVEDLKGKIKPFSNFFFVEKHPRIEKPLLEGFEVIQIPEHVEIRKEIPAVVATEKLEEIAIREPEPIELITTEVTQIKGLGKTYATRLLKLNVKTVHEFYSFEDRTILAETMRVTDKKLNVMLNEAKRILDESYKIEKEPKITVTLHKAPYNQLLDIPGIGAKTVQKLSTIGITAIDDLVHFKELEKLRKILRFSASRLNKLLVSLGKEIPTETLVEDKSQKYSSDDPVINLKGIGKKTAANLNSKGIFTVNDLLNSDYSKVKGIISHNRFEKWQEAASSYLSGEKMKVAKPKIESELLSLPGIGQKKLNKLNGIGIFSIKDLIEYKDTMKLRKTLRMSEHRFNTFIATLNKQ